MESEMMPVYARLRSGATFRVTYVPRPVTGDPEPLEAAEIGIPARRVYKDTKKNRGLGRVGLPLFSRPESGIVRRYVDNAMNRRLGRVGLPYGSAPVVPVDEVEIARSSVLEEEVEASRSAVHQEALVVLEEEEVEIARSDVPEEVVIARDPTVPEEELVVPELPELPVAEEEFDDEWSPLFSKQLLAYRNARFMVEYLGLTVEKSDVVHPPAELAEMFSLALRDIAQVSHLL